MDVGAFVCSVRGQMMDASLFVQIADSYLYVDKPKEVQYIQCWLGDKRWIPFYLRTVNTISC